MDLFVTLIPTSPIGYVAAALAVALISISLPTLPLYFHVRMAWVVLQRGFLCRLKLAHARAQVVLNERVWLSDMDFNLHCNNAVYNTVLDYARAALFASLLRDPVRSIGKVKFANGGVSMFFLKEMRFLQAYRTRTFISSWDDKWVYVAHIFEDAASGALHAVGVTRVVFKEPRGKTIPPLEFFAAQSLPTETESDGGGGGGSTPAAAAARKTATTKSKNDDSQSPIPELVSELVKQLQALHSGTTRSGAGSQ